MQKNVIVMNCQYGGFNPMQFGFENCEPSHCYGPAVRPHWLLHYVVSGKGVFHREGEIYSIGAGDIFVIPPYLETYYEADAKEPWQYIWIGFTAEGEVPCVFDAPIIQCAGVGAIFEEMKRCRDLENGRSAFLSARLWELVSLLQEQGTSRVDYVEMALNCMHAEYMRDLNVQDIADRLNLDRSYFSGLFCKKMGVPPGRYLQTLRLEKAAELMLRYGESPSMAGASVGYPDLYHFSKVFKKHFGLSPRSYIKNKING